MAADTYTRRLTETQTLDINQMIADESDPKHRAFLIVLNSINQNLEANTRTICDINDRLESHIDLFTQHSSAEQILVAQGRGAWKVLAWVLSIAQVGVIGLFVNINAQLGAFAERNQQAEINLVQLTTRLDTIEKQEILLRK